MRLRSKSNFVAHSQSWGIMGEYDTYQTAMQVMAMGYMAPTAPPGEPPIPHALTKGHVIKDVVLYERKEAPTPERKEAPTPRSQYNEYEKVGNA